MAGKTYDGTYLNGVSLTHPGTQNPATVGTQGYVTNEGSVDNGTALVGSAAAAWTVQNLGRIYGQSSTGDGIRLLAGGAVTNGASGSVGGLITANRSGVEIDAKPGTVTNFGVILGLGAQGQGIDLRAGGTIVNGGGLIEGTTDGVAIRGAAGSVTNAGTLISSAGEAVLLADGGTAINRRAIAGASSGIAIYGNPGTVVNSGTIVSTSSNAGGGVYFKAGGHLANQKSGRITAVLGDGVRAIGGAATVTNSGTIIGGAGTSGDGIYLGGAAGKVTNHGTISSTAGAAVVLGDGGSVTNHRAIQGALYGIVIGGKPGTVVNWGTIVTTSGNAGGGVYLKAGGRLTNEKPGGISAFGDGVRANGAAASITNFGTIVGGAGTSAAAVYLGGGGSVTNGKRGQAFGLISGSGSGVVLNNAAGTVHNFGTILSTSTAGNSGSPSGVGVLLGAGGTLVNGAAGAGGSGALISARELAVYIGGFGGTPNPDAPGTVVNFGTIVSTGGAAYGAAAVLLASGGEVTNHALIESAAGSGVQFRNAPGTVTNFGSIVGNAKGTGGVGVYLHGGVVTNEASGVITAAFNEGVAVGNGRGTVVNLGMIVGGRGSGGSAVYLGGGGSVTNGESGTTLGLINGRGSAVVLNNTVGTVTNYGTIESSGRLHAAGVLLGAGGTLINGNGGSNSHALISATEAGVYIGGIYGTPDKGALGTVTNYGTIQSTGRGASASAAVRLVAGGTVTNQGLIESARLFGIWFGSTSGTVINSGRVVSNATGSGGSGVYLQDGGSVDNQPGGVIKAAVYDGVEIKNAAGAIVNLASIESGKASGSAAVYLGGGGVVTNGQSGSQAGLISSGAGSGVVLANKSGRVTNFGTIKATGSSAAGAGVEFAAGGRLTNYGRIASRTDTAVLFANTAGSITNFGAIVSTSNQTTGAGIDFEDGGRVTNRLGGIIGGNRNSGLSVEGAAGTIDNFGTIKSASGDAVYLAAGGSLTNRRGAVIEGGVHGVFLVNPSGTMTNRGTIKGGGAGFVTLGPGTDTLDNFGRIAGAGGVAVEVDGSTGGFTLIVEPHAVFVGSLSGGGASEIEFKGGGTANMSNAFGFAAIDLADGVQHTLTLTAANFVDVTGATITITDGDKGDTVSAASLTAADAIIVHAGGDGDILTGGAGNDVFYAFCRTMMTGGAGTNEFVFGKAGKDTITDFTASLTNELVFSNSGFSLGLPNPSSTPQVLPSDLVSVSSSGSFTSSTQRFSYNTTNGDLYYSASGSNANKELVVALTGAPPLTTTPVQHLFYIT